MNLFLARWLHPRYGDIYKARSPAEAAMKHAETLGLRRAVITVTPADLVEGLGLVALRHEYSRWTVKRSGSVYIPNRAHPNAWPRNVQP